jgi:putative FmdB family regulatory protein
MPIYEYRCRECNEITTELRVAARRNKSSICKQCGGLAIRRLERPARFRRSPGWHARMGDKVPGPL